jgi:drug/metabolite transporter (DMT)-like permease
LKIAKFKIISFALLSMLFWSCSFIWVKVVYAHHYHPIMTIFLRLVISSIILTVAIKLMKKGQKIDKKDYGKFLLLALTQPFCYFIGESFALTMISSTIAAVIISTLPVITPIFSYLFVKEKISFVVFFGLILSFAGIMLMVFNQNFTFDASPLGVCLEFFAVASAIAYAIVVKKLTGKYSSFTIIKAQNILGALYFMPLFFIFDFKQFISVPLDTDLVFSMLMLAVFASSGAYMLYIPVVRELGVNKANMYTNLIPVFTAILSFFILSETFNFNKIIGIVIVVAGVSLSQLYKMINKIV